MFALGVADDDRCNRGRSATCARQCPRIEAQKQPTFVTPTLLAKEAPGSVTFFVLPDRPADNAWETRPLPNICWARALDFFFRSFPCWSIPKRKQMRALVSLTGLNHIVQRNGASVQASILCLGHCWGHRDDCPGSVSSTDRKTRALECTAK